MGGWLWGMCRKAPWNLVDGVRLGWPMNVSGILDAKPFLRRPADLGTLAFVQACSPGRLTACLLLVWQSRSGPEAAPMGPGRGQKRRRGLCAPGELGLLQELRPSQGSGALDAGCAGER